MSTSVWSVISPFKLSTSWVWSHLRIVSFSFPTVWVFPSECLLTMNQRAGPEGPSLYPWGPSHSGVSRFLGPWKPVSSPTLTTMCSVSCDFATFCGRGRGLLRWFLLVRFQWSREWQFPIPFDFPRGWDPQRRAVCAFRLQFVWVKCWCHSVCGGSAWDKILEVCSRYQSFFCVFYLHLIDNFVDFFWTRLTTSKEKWSTIFVCCWSGVWKSCGVMSWVPTNSPCKFRWRYSEPR